MHSFRDPAGVARAAVIAVSVYAVVDLLTAIANYLMPLEPGQFGLTGALSLLMPFAFLASVILVGRWIYRTNANAHSFSEDVSIKPGWSVGWFFVQFANLVKPYESMKDVWAVSHQAAAHYEDLESPLVRWWWGLWIATNIASGISMRLSGMDSRMGPAIAIFDIVLAIAEVVLSIVLIQLIQRLSRTQLVASRNHVFA